MKLYEEGYELKDDEYLLKIRHEDGDIDTGFLTKFNKNGSIPAAFKDWGINQYYSDIYLPPLNIYVIKEKFRSNWKLHSWRFGKSRNWASLIHPEGFTVEIYLSNFLDIIKDTTIIDGEIQGKFKWVYSNLIKNY